MQYSVRRSMLSLIHEQVKHPPFDMFQSASSVHRILLSFKLFKLSKAYSIQYEIVS